MRASCLEPASFFGHLRRLFGLFALFLFRGRAVRCPARRPARRPAHPMVSVDHHRPRCYCGVCLFYKALLQSAAAINFATSSAATHAASGGAAHFDAAALAARSLSATALSAAAR